MKSEPTILNREKEREGSLLSLSNSAFARSKQIGGEMKGKQQLLGLGAKALLFAVQVIINIASATLARLHRIAPGREHASRWHETERGRAKLSGFRIGLLCQRAPKQKEGETLLLFSHLQSRRRLARVQCQG